MQSLDILKKILELTSGSFALIAGLVTALWAYSKFVLERGILPPVQFNVECKSAGFQGDKNVIEVLLHMKNLGASTLITKNIRVDILYMDAADPASLFDDPSTPAFGRLRFSRSIRKDLIRVNAAPQPAQPVPSAENVSLSMKKEHKTENQRGISILPYDTFVQSGVDQVFTLITAVPSTTSYVLVWASFQYAQHPARLARVILFISRHLGLIQYSLDHVTKPHTTERIFRISDTQPAGQAA